MSGGVTRTPIADRFWQKVKRTSGCWLWTASIDSRGYGHLVREGRNVPARAHRVSWELAFGEIPPGMYVLHRCDNKICVNPKHLFLGTHADNMGDMVSKGRYRKGHTYRGSTNAMAKLTEEDVLNIKRLRASGIGPVEIGKMYNVHYRHIWAIVTGLKWAHL